MQHLHDIRATTRRAIIDDDMPALERLGATLLAELRGGGGGSDIWERGVIARLIAKATR